MLRLVCVCGANFKVNKHFSLTEKKCDYFPSLLLHLLLIVGTGITILEIVRWCNKFPTTCKVQPGFLSPRTDMCASHLKMKTCM